MERINKLKNILWIILGVGAAVGITRFLFGLGATTNLTDNHPWGFWIGFDVMGGVALAAGGFVIAAFHYIFGKREFHAIARAAILTAFLGYIAVVGGLLFDLGLPWNIWHMVIFWNPHSPLFEVGWCVMLYSAVLFLEFAPVILEKFPNTPFIAKAHRFLYKIRIPIVILGIMLSTLHQSSLGSLFLAMPYKLHPLWYTPVIPVIFFISAICLGLMMVMFESMATSYLYRKPQETDILKKLAKAASIMLIFYFLFRMGDIVIRGADSFLFSGGIGSWLFWIEMAVSVFFPVAVFLLPRARRNINLLFAAAASGVVGVVFNRLNVGGLTHLNNIGGAGDFYFPSWMELFVSAGVVSAAALAFFFFIENFNIWERRPKFPGDKPGSAPRLDSRLSYMGPSKAANRARFSFSFVLAFAIGFAVISGETIYGEGYDKTPSRSARGGDTLFIDGNRDGYGVNFKHKFHQDKGITCGQCHHMNKPGDKSTECFECHSNQYSQGDAFRHDWHASEEGGAIGCFGCHNEGMNKSRESAMDKTGGCTPCHDDIIPPDSEFKMESFITRPYVDALHTQCIGCHRESLKNNPELKEAKPGLGRCATCHPPGEEFSGSFKMFGPDLKTNRWVVIPPMRE